MKRSKLSFHSHHPERRGQLLFHKKVKLEQIKRLEYILKVLQISCLKTANMSSLSMVPLKILMKQQLFQSSFWLVMKVKVQQTLTEVFSKEQSRNSPVKLTELFLLLTMICQSVSLIISRHRIITLQPKVID